MAAIAHQCPHCLVENIALDIVAQSWGGPPNYLHLGCSGCGMPSAVEMVDETGRGRLASVEEFPASIQRFGWRVARLWPAVPTPNIPDHLPPEVARAFQQAETAFPQKRMEEPAAGSYGRALDIGTRALAPKFEGTLFGRIKHLAAEGLITRDLAEWAHEVRLVRNDALHTPEGVTRAELTDVRGLTDMILRYMFTLPGMIRARRAEAARAATTG